MEQYLSQYKIFYEVAKAGNISHAAKALYISQPAISKAISKLEEGLDTTLFARNSRGVSLTMEGRLLFKHIDTAFSAISLGEQQLKRVRDFNMGEIRIGVSNTLCRYILLPYLKEFIASFPHVKVNIASQSTAHTVEMLENNLLDIGLIAKSNTRRNFDFRPVMDIHDIFAASPEYLHNLRLREGEDCDVLSLSNIMLLDKNNVSRKHIDSYLAANNIVLNQVLEVTTMDLLIEFAKTGIGTACVVKEFVSDELKKGSLVEIGLPSSVEKRTVGFAYSPANPNPMLESFLGKISS